MENEKKMRREIANSNERRRMQSINAGFQSLRSLLPHHEGEKLSKVSRIHAINLHGNAHTLNLPICLIKFAIMRENQLWLQYVCHPLCHTCCLNVFQRKLEAHATQPHDNVTNALLSLVFLKCHTQSG